MIGSEDEILKPAQSGNFYATSMNKYFAGDKSKASIHTVSDFGKPKSKDSMNITENKSFNRQNNFRGHIKAKATADPNFFFSRNVKNDIKTTANNHRYNQQAYFHAREKLSVFETQSNNVKEANEDKLNISLAKKEGYKIPSITFKKEKSNNNVVVSLLTSSADQNPRSQFQGNSGLKKMSMGSGSLYNVNKNISKFVKVDNENQETQRSIPLRNNSSEHIKIKIEEDDGTYRPDEYEKVLYFFSKD